MSQGLPGALGGSGASPPLSTPSDLTHQLRALAAGRRSGVGSPSPCRSMKGPAVFFSTHTQAEARVG